MPWNGIDRSVSYDQRDPDRRRQPAHEGNDEVAIRKKGAHSLMAHSKRQVGPKHKLRPRPSQKVLPEQHCNSCGHARFRDEGSSRFRILQCRRRQQYHNNDDDEPLPSRQKNSRTTGGHIRLRWLKDCRSRDLAQPDSVESVG